MKTLSSRPLDLCGRSSSWRLKEFRVFFEKLFDSGRDSGAKRQQWSCKGLSPSAPAWVREQQEGGGEKGKCGASWLTAVGVRDPHHPLSGGKHLLPTAEQWVLLPLSPDASAGYQNASTAVEQATPPGPSLEKLGLVSRSQWPVGQTDAPPPGCSETVQKASKQGPSSLGP